MPGTIPQWLCSHWEGAYSHRRNSKFIQNYFHLFINFINPDSFITLIYPLLLSLSLVLTYTKLLCFLNELPFHFLLVSSCCNLTSLLPYHSIEIGLRSPMVIYCKIFIFPKLFYNTGYQWSLLKLSSIRFSPVFLNLLFWPLLHGFSSTIHT